MDKKSRWILFLIFIFLIPGCIGERIDPQKAAARTVRAGDIDISYKVFGRGDPLIMIMGYGATMDLWDVRVLEALAAHYKVIIFDNRGMGRTSASDKEFSIELFADDTAHLMDALGIKCTHVLGYSMGTGIAQELALRYPQKVSKLILYAADCGGKEGIYPAPEAMRQLTDTTCPPQERADRLIKLLLPEEWLKAHPDPQNYLPFPKEPISIESTNRQTKAMTGWKGAFSRLAQIKQQTLLITGTEDVLMPPENSLLMVQHIPRAWLIQIEGGGHGLMYQWPDKFSKCILAFLEGQ
jgi:pimeloyl-ACP methyl ester carboxylesterase